MKKLSLIFIFLLSTLMPAYAGESAEAYVQADLVSAYLWRGQKNAGVSIQPVLGIRWRGLNFYI